MDIIDAVRRVLFEQTFGVADSDSEAKAALLRRVGVPEDEIAGFCRPGLHVGMTLGGAHLIDVQLAVERVLFAQKAGSVTVRVAHDPHDAGHLRIEIVGIEPPAGEEPNP